MAELNRPQLSVSVSLFHPSSNRTCGFAASGFPGTLRRLAFGSCVFPCGPSGQFPEFVSLMEQFIGVRLVFASPAFVPPPEPTPHTRTDELLHRVEDAGAVAVVEVGRPAFDLAVEGADGFFLRDMQSPVIE